jgi:ubiquitin-associated SH3 domain-containing protein
MSPEFSELIVYACPTGPLAEQIDSFFARSLQQFGPNTAHRYMPHCTLTGFFHDRPASIPVYVDALDAALNATRSSMPQPPLQITAMVLSDMFKYLKVESDWMIDTIRDFAGRVHSPTRSDDLRLKSWLHLSLAYDHAPEHEMLLNDLARRCIDPAAQADWDLRFYERFPTDQWTLHASWKIATTQASQFSNAKHASPSSEGGKN